MSYIGIFTDYNFHYCREIAKGALNHLNLEGNYWAVDVFPLSTSKEGIQKLVETRKMKGAIAHLARSEMTEFFLDSGLPFVNTSQARAQPPLPLVGTDNFTVGRLAADYLIQKNLPYLAVEFNRTQYGRDRKAGFIQAAKEQGIEVIDLNGANENS